MKPTDVQNIRISDSFVLTRVGVTGVKKPMSVHRPKGAVTVIANIDAFVDLPQTLKGSHMSRNIEIINEAMVQEPVKSLEAMCLKLAHTLLKRHDYATRSEVMLTADYFLERRTPSGRPTLENYKIMAKALCDKAQNVYKKMIGVEVIGMTACPCAQVTARNIMNERDNIEVPANVPFITHNQRNIVSIMIEVPENAEIEADDLIDIAESSVSSPTYGTLKRGDEAAVVINAHSNPKFVEDVVRDALMRIRDKYSYLPDDALVTVRSTAEESIHKHCAMAERSTTIGKLKEGENFKPLPNTCA